MKFKTDEAAAKRKAEILEQIFGLSQNLQRLKKNHPEIFSSDDDLFIENIGRSVSQFHKEGKSARLEIWAMVQRRNPSLHKLWKRFGFGHDERIRRRVY